MPDAEVSIEFSNPTAVYYPGSVVAGLVKIDVPEDMKARKITIEIDGRAHSNWSDSERIAYSFYDNAPRRRYQRVYYSSNIIYGHTELTPWVSQGEEELLPAGHYEYPFQYTLPSFCAPSFEGEYGYIRYKVKAEVDRPWSFDDFRESLFTVAPTCDLNLIPQALEPAHDQNREEIGVMFFTHGEVEIQMNLPKSGFVPGESIVVDALIKNDSERPVIEAELRLKQASTFTAFRDGWTGDYQPGMMTACGGQERTDKRLVAEISVPLEIAPKSEGRARVALTVPPTVASLNICPTVKVKYYVVFRITTKGHLCNHVECSADVLIGTVPVRAGAVPPAAVSTDPEVPVYPAVPPADATAPPLEQGDTQPSAPPSYEESVFGINGTKIFEGDSPTPKAFAPRYPVYPDLGLQQGLLPN